MELQHDFEVQSWSKTPTDGVGTSDGCRKDDLELGNKNGVERAENPDGRGRAKMIRRSSRGR